MTAWTVAYQAPLSMGFLRQEFGAGCHFLFQVIVLTQGLNPHLLHWQVDSLPLIHQGNPADYILVTIILGNHPILPTHAKKQLTHIEKQFFTSTGIAENQRQDKNGQILLFLLGFLRCVVYIY